ncbi:MAG: hypothetical protein KatS3mg113_0397 [Planctomycetaceae bacterium]|nr:MAG: hypothetical protein KatS3mg113_0397 [Planctomycetaceae bacterium]
MKARAMCYRAANWGLMICLGTMSALVDAQEAKKAPNRIKTAYLSAEEAGPDFQIQGEYVGELHETKWGLQVVARGEGKFEAWLLKGGLPGAGWDQKTRRHLQGNTHGDETPLKGEHVSAVVVGDAVRLEVDGVKGVLSKVLRQSPTLGMKPPAGAVVLFDGRHAEHWNPPKLMDDGLLGVGTRTRQSFTNFTLHLEFRTPFMPYATGQARGNSGMYLQDQYEIQILDSFGLEGLDNECGGLYSVSRPAVNMCLPPLTWQTYDVEFTTAKLDEHGKIVEPARATIRHNGVVIHENVGLKITPGGGRNDGKPGPLYLQDHGDPVRFRNIWIVPRD